MSCIPDMVPGSLLMAVAPRTGKFIKNGLSICVRGKFATKRYIIYFVLRFSQLSEIALES